MRIMVHFGPQLWKPPFVILASTSSRPLPAPPSDLLSCSLPHGTCGCFREMGSYWWGPKESEPYYLGPILRRLIFGNSRVRV